MQATRGAVVVWSDMCVLSVFERTMLPRSSMKTASKSYQRSRGATRQRLRLHHFFGQPKNKLQREADRPAGPWQSAERGARQLRVGRWTRLRGCQALQMRHWRGCCGRGGQCGVV